MLVTDTERLRGRDVADVVRAAVDGGVDVVQVREKSLAHGALVALATRVREAIAGRAMLFVNGDVEAAIEAGADGVHLPASGPAVAAVRARVGDALVISRAVHSIDAAVGAERDSADMLVLGTVFPSPSHPGAQTIGLDGVREVCVRVAIPVIAIGGITPANARDIMRAGAAGVAVIGSIMDADDPRAAAEALRIAIAAPVGQADIPSGTARPGA